MGTDTFHYYIQDLLKISKFVHRIKISVNRARRLPLSNCQELELLLKSPSEGFDFFFSESSYTAGKVRSLESQVPF